MSTTSDLTASHWIPDGSGPPLLAGATVGSRLREVAAEVPDRVALVEGLAIPERRCWTYAQLALTRFLAIRSGDRRGWWNIATVVEDAALGMGGLMLLRRARDSR
jgi:hypothetical protein